jgi:predicted 2-oxoglutarate/Fe(II)-dependent dioxygenase YbiX
MSLPTATRAPDFLSSTPASPRFVFCSASGRYTLLVFFPGPSAERDAVAAVVGENRDLFHDDNCVFFGVLPDEATYANARDRDGMRWFPDFTGELRKLYNAVDENGGVRPEWFVIDPGFRILAWGPISTVAEAISHLRRLGDADDHAGVRMSAPVLIVPRILEPAFCRELIACYEADGGCPSGVMRPVDGRAAGQLDDFKRRRDAQIPAGPLIDGLRNRMAQRLLPEIKIAFNFEATRIERYIVACYDQADGGYFLPHRDNGMPETAHRKFAVSINLNSEEFEGGELRFPEYGRRTYRAPTGGAVVFAAGLMHEATPVVRGRRYVTLPFLYDEDGARLRAAILDRPHASAEAAASQAP